MAYSTNPFSVATFGESYEQASPTVLLTGVVGIGAVDTNVDVSSRTTVVLVGTQGDGAIGSPSPQAKAVLTPASVSATGTANTVTATGGTGVIFTTNSVSATGNVTTGFNLFSAFTAYNNAQLSTAQQKFGTASLLLDGTDDYVEADSTIDLSSGDFTVDMWIRPDNVIGYKGLFQSGTSSLLNVYLIGDQVQGTVAGSTTIFLSSTRVSANVWTMITVEREGNVHRLYINGTLEGSSSTANRPDNGTFSIGKNGFGDFDGYIDEVRLSNVAQYTGTGFTPPTSAFTVDDDTLALLHFDGTNASTDIVNAVNLAYLFVLAKAVVAPTGVEADVITDDPLVSGDEIIVDAKAVFSVTGVGGTGAVDDVTILVDSVIVPTGVEGVIITDSIFVDGDEIVVDAGANISLEDKGVEGTVSGNTVTTDCQAVVLPVGVQGTFTVGNETIDTVQFDYEAIKNNYSRLRTDYVREADMGSRTVYVEAQTSSYRTAYARAA